MRNTNRVCFSGTARGLSKVNSTSNPNQATNSSAPGSSDPFSFTFSYNRNNSVGYVPMIFLAPGISSQIYVRCSLPRGLSKRSECPKFLYRFIEYYVSNSDNLRHREVMAPRRTRVRSGLLRGPFSNLPDTSETVVYFLMLQPMIQDIIRSYFPTPARFSL